jgi:hypothetical protein
MTQPSDGLIKMRFDQLETVAHREGVQVKGTGRGGYPTRADLIRDIRDHRKGLRKKTQQEKGGYVREAGQD